MSKNKIKYNLKNVHAAVLTKTLTDGEYSYAANFLDKPGLLIERGGCAVCMPEWTEDYRRDIRLLLDHLGIYPAEATDRSASEI